MSAPSHRKGVAERDALQRMYHAVYTPEHGWKGQMEDYACLQIEPAAQVLNYGQSVFEGMKAQRNAKGQILLFRPQENAARMAQGTFLHFLSYKFRDRLPYSLHGSRRGFNISRKLVRVLPIHLCNLFAAAQAPYDAISGRKNIPRMDFHQDSNGKPVSAYPVGAERLVMPVVPEGMYLDAICAVVRENASYVPPEGKGSLYIRPVLMGSGPILGLGPAPSFTFYAFAAAVGSYFKVRPCPGRLHRQAGTVFSFA